MAFPDVLNPKLRWVGNRCYRSFVSDEDGSESSEDEMESFEEQSTSEIDIKIVDAGNSYMCSLRISRALFAEISGVIRKLERSLKVQIQLPMEIRKQDSKSDSGELLIKGTRKVDVEKCYRRLQVCIDRTRLYMPFTHFISVPMCFPELKKSFLQFRNDVLKHCQQVRGVDASIFQDPNKLHLTVVPLVLLDQKEIENATLNINEQKDNIKEILCGRPLVVRVKGIEYMNDDPEEVDVLYGKVIETVMSDCLQRICNLLLRKFVEQKFNSQLHDEEHVKLHMTLMNSLWRDKNKQPKKQDSKNQRETFDARKILQKYAEYDFGEFLISEIHLSIRYTADDRGYYKSSTVHHLPIA